MEEAPNEEKGRNLQEDYKKSHELQASGRELLHFTHIYEANKREWARVDEAIG